MPQSGKKRKNQKDLIVELRQELERVKNENKNLTDWNQNLYQNSKSLLVYIVHRKLDIIKVKIKMLTLSAFYFIVF